MKINMTRRSALQLSAAAILFPQASRADDTLKIGMISPLSGSSAEPGRIQVNSARLAIDEVNEGGGVLGRKLELIVEDDQTSNPGAVLAFSRLASRGDIVGFIGSIRSTQMQAIAPDIMKTKRPVMFGGTDPTLTKLGNPWMFRCRPSDSYTALAITEYVTKSLDKKKIAIVHTTDAFGNNGVKILLETMERAELRPTLKVGYTNQQLDFTSVVLAVKQSDADIIVGYMAYENDVAVFARQLRQLGVRTPWIGTATITSPVVQKLAGRAMAGTYGIADFSPDANPEARAFTDKFKKMYKETPDYGWTYDGVKIIARGLQDAKTTDADQLRAAILKLKKYKGTEGEYNFDENGDGLHGYNVLRNDGEQLHFEKHLEFAA
jgi:branched-chain amino acid transport system substrate-binding protein